jgi:hypothetical protein
LAVPVVAGGRTRLHSFEHEKVMIGIDFDIRRLARRLRCHASRRRLAGKLGRRREASARVHVRFGSGPALATSSARSSSPTSGNYLKAGIKGNVTGVIVTPVKGG